MSRTENVQGCTNHCLIFECVAILSKQKFCSPKILHGVLNSPPIGNTDCYWLCVTTQAQTLPG